MEDRNGISEMLLSLLGGMYRRHYAHLRFEPRNKIMFVFENENHSK